MEIKKGYKMTDVGVIPEDWEVKSIGEMYSFKNGLNKDKDSFGFGTPIINYMDVYKNNGLTSKCIKGKVSLSDYEISYFLVKKGDVFFTRTSETPEEVGIASVLLDELPKGVFSGFLLRARPNGNDIEPLLCKYIFTTESFRSSVIQNSTYTTRALTNGAILSSLYVAFPKSIVEQQAIADALTKVDKLITSLTKVIEKKKLIKKGAMQKLLSGEMRLDGFEGEWIKIKLGDISSIKTGSRNVEEHSANGKYPFFVRSKEVMKINTFSYDEEAILVPGEGGIGEIFHYVNGKFDVHQRVYKISDFNDKVNALFIYWYMIIFFGEYAKENTVKATVDSLRLPTFTDFICCLPPTKAEQTAIAKVLTTMDDEIEALEKERDKYKCIKQGMMQQLLTGKIRLICQ